MTTNASPRRTPRSALPGLWYSVGVLLRAQLQIARNTWWRGKRSRKFATLGVLLAASSIAFTLFRFTGAIIRFLTGANFAEVLRETARATPDANLPLDVGPLLVSLPSAVLFGAFLVLILTSFSTVLSSLYLSGDIDMLVVAPVPMRAVFVMKFFGSLLGPYVVLFALVAPVLLGFGQGLGYGPLFAVVALVVLLLFPLLPVGVGTLLVVAVVRVVPARRAREMVTVLGGLMGVLFYGVSQFTREVTERYGNVETFAALRRLDLPVLPSAWASRALVAAGEGAVVPLVAYGGLFVMASLGVFAGVVILAERLYYVGWSNMANQGGRKRQPRRAPVLTADSGRVGRLSSRLPSDLRALILKDLRLFRRDLRNLQQVIFPLAVALIWTFRILTGDQSDSDAAAQLGAAAGLGIALYVCMVVSSGVSGPGVNREGRGYWQLKLAPISAQRILLGKWVLGWLPFFTLGPLLLVAFALLQRSAWTAVLEGCAVLLIAGAATSALNVGLSATFPRFNWTNPRQQTSTVAGCLTPLLSVIYIVVGAALVLGPRLLAQFVPASAQLAVQLVGWLVFIAVSIGLAVGILLLGAHRLERAEVG